jgi:hypothetical protein
MKSLKILKGNQKKDRQAVLRAVNFWVLVEDWRGRRELGSKGAGNR